MRTKAAAARLPLSPSQRPSTSTSTLRRPDDYTTQRVARASEIPSRSEDDRIRINCEVDSGTSGDSDDGTDVCGTKCCRFECSVVEHTCVQCTRGGQGLLVCSEISCPIAFHEECFGIKPQVDGTGKFYCPYCWYRRGVCRTKELREKVLKAKKGFMDFIGSKMPDDGRGMGNGVGVAESVRERIRGGCLSEMKSDGRVRVEVVEDHRKGERGGVEEERVTRLPDSVDGGVDVCLGKEKGMATVEAIEDSSSEEEVDEKEDISDSEKSENFEDGRLMQEQDDGVADDLDEVVCGDGEHAEPLKAEPLNVYPMLVHETIHEDAYDDGNQWDTTENTAMATRAHAFPKVPEISGLDAVTPVRPKRIKRSPYIHEAQSKNCISSMKSRPQPSMTSGKEVRNLMKEVTPSKICGQHPVSCKKWPSQTIFANDKRKRLHWTSEEEEMLEEGVTKFSSTANKNLPWRKILKFGHHIFDSTRTPSDLKDKWRSMGKKT